MDSKRFDDLTRLLARTPSRRRLLSGLVGAAAGLVTKSIGAAPCKGVGFRCRDGSDCCSGVCDPASRQCIATCTDGDGVCGFLSPCAPGCSCYLVELDGGGRACLQDPPNPPECPDTLQCSPSAANHFGCPCSKPEDCPKGYACTASSCCGADSVCLPLCEPAA
jgi:hypothetical protein